jgi:hypothetical protein
MAIRTLKSFSQISRDEVFHYSDVEFAAKCCVSLPYRISFISRSDGSTGHGMILVTTQQFNEVSF